jgi:hypothetical protein
MSVAALAGETKDRIEASVSAPTVAMRLMGAFPRAEAVVFFGGDLSSERMR